MKGNSSHPPGDHKGRQKNRHKLSVTERAKLGIVPQKKKVMVIRDGKKRMYDIDST